MRETKGRILSPKWSSQMVQTDGAAGWCKPMVHIYYIRKVELNGLVRWCRHMMQMNGVNRWCIQMVQT